MRCGISQHPISSWGRGHLAISVSAYSGVRYNLITNTIDSGFGDIRYAIRRDTTRYGYNNRMKFEMLITDTRYRSMAVITRRVSRLSQLVQSRWMHSPTTPYDDSY